MKMKDQMCKALTWLWSMHLFPINLNILDHSTTIHIYSYNLYIDNTGANLFFQMVTRKLTDRQKACLIESTCQVLSNKS